MNKKNRKYSREFKIEAVRLSEEENRSIAEVAWLLAIHPKKLYKWHARFGEKGEEAFLSKGVLPGSDEEINRLREENNRLREQYAILRKALAFSAAATNSDFDKAGK